MANYITFDALNYSWIVFLMAAGGIRACLQGDGGPQIGEVTRLGGLTRLYMLGGVTHHLLPHLPGVPHLHVNRR